ncbi:secretion protein EspI [Mycobacteroides sp. H001]|uniref:MinD/ParA family ATP-binding protein n=1 Tax=Mycobacteroides TaxID=670516 RepID=UPI000712772C|nr:MULTISPECIES: MinD/ParA family protein [Mycobacteroides]KRQ27988.1 secretion protein EspI [Mycobacteroides sp. H072]KRQ41589.1 secretion protein EspI [Mycobacteroides sp. H002]KRQ49904.1 secretion protein EspI [Mycobacteroides sp. H054]KRQ67473.1 secretion protein EspI [Mycobacteroides sp. H001]OHU43789.1 secretion protein EspI [Mycobacteroides chelonae]
MADSQDNTPNSPPPSGPWREPVADGLGGGDTKGNPFRRSKNPNNQEFVPPSADYFPQPTLKPPSPLPKTPKLSRRQRNHQRPMNPIWEPDPLSAYGMPQYQNPAPQAPPRQGAPQPPPQGYGAPAQRPPQNYYGPPPQNYHAPPAPSAPPPGPPAPAEPVTPAAPPPNPEWASQLPAWPTSAVMPESSVGAPPTEQSQVRSEEEAPRDEAPDVEVPPLPPVVPAPAPQIRPDDASSMIPEGKTPWGGQVPQTPSAPTPPAPSWAPAPPLPPAPVAPPAAYPRADWNVSAAPQQAPFVPGQTPFTAARPEAPVYRPPQPPQPSRPQGPSHDQLGLIRSVKPLPRSGWRKAVHRLSGGAINPGESSDESHRSELIDRINLPVRGDYRIAVLSLKGGVGKTTTTFSLGATFASLRGDRVIAVDANPDFGTLAQRGPDETRSTARDLLRDPDIHRYSDVRRHTSQSASRLEVLASERDPAASELFSEADYLAVMRILQRFYNIILTDCGTGLMHSAMAGVLGEANAIVLVTSPAIDGARSALATLDWLDHHGYSHLVRQSVVAISSSRPGASSIDLEQLSRHFLTRARAVHIVPFDNHLSEGSEISLDLMGKKTRLAFMELAASVADGFYEGGNTRQTSWG